MPYPATAIANAFLSLAKREGRQLSNMQLQKLVYIAHGFYLALTGQPLIQEDVEAWQWGPVIPELYQALRQYGAGVVTGPISESTSLDNRASDIIEKVWKAYGKFSAFELSTITHKANSPWRQAREQRSPWHQVIENDIIKRYYRSLLHERTKPATATERL